MTRTDFSYRSRYEYRTPSSSFSAFMDVHDFAFFKDFRVVLTVFHGVDMGFHSRSSHCDGTAMSAMTFNGHSRAFIGFHELAWAFMAVPWVFMTPAAKGKR